jgi:hypothetical protein
VKNIKKTFISLQVFFSSSSSKLTNKELYLKLFTSAFPSVIIVEQLEVEKRFG